MVKSNQISPGMVLAINRRLYSVESSVKVTVPKGTPFIKTKLKSFTTDKSTEKNFKLNQEVEVVSRDEKELEFLYPEDDDFLFLDTEELEPIKIPGKIIGEHIHYLKEGVEVKAIFYGKAAHMIELPQFLELMVIETDGEEGAVAVSNVTKTAFLETGAKVEVPPFIEAGDIIKVDTRSEEFVQRV